MLVHLWHHAGVLRLGLQLLQWHGGRRHRHIYCHQQGAGCDVHGLLSDRFFIVYSNLHRLIIIFILLLLNKQRWW